VDRALVLHFYRLEAKGSSGVNNEPKNRLFFNPRLRSDADAVWFLPSTWKVSLAASLKKRTQQSKTKQTAYFFWKWLQLCTV